MIETVTCTVLKCDRCKDGWSNDGEYDGTPHFDDEADLRRYLAEFDDERAWTQLDHPFFDAEPGRDTPVIEAPWLCPSCAQRQSCANRGHHDFRWSACHCGGERHGDRVEYGHCADCPETGARRVLEGQHCEPPYPPPIKLSDGAMLIQHRRNHHIFTAAHPERASGPHEVPEAVEGLVEQGAEIAARIDAALPDGFYV